MPDGVSSMNFKNEFTNIKKQLDKIAQQLKANQVIFFLFPYENFDGNFYRLLQASVYWRMKATLLWGCMEAVLEIWTAIRRSQTIMK